MQNPFNHKLGFTLLETIIVLGIFIFVSSVVMTFIVLDLKAHRFALEQNEAIRHAQKGIQLMVKEIREASTGDNGDYPINSADDQTFIFYGDIDQDEAVERVRYFLDGTELKKGIIEPSGWPIEYSLADEVVKTISKYVRNGDEPIFYYYNGDWPGDTINNPMTTPADVDQIKLIKMHLKINFNPQIAPDDFELETYAQIRNLKDNL
jgi:type II secretory pathway pseudopilin PulG